jgi:flagellar basal-body rod protein FlgG
MLRALSCAATGGRALLARIDLHAHNLANAETTGFKRSRAEFADLLSQHVDGARFGAGVRLVATSAVQEQGALVATGRALDLAIEGEGYFRVVHPETGDVAYTRAGHFLLDAAGRLATPDGWRLDPPQSGTKIDLAALRLFRFADPAAPRADGSNLLRAVPAAGDAVEFPGLVRQGFLERSNVDVIRELTDLVAAHRAFEINGKVIEAADEALRSIASLRSSRS